MARVGLGEIVRAARRGALAVGAMMLAVLAAGVAGVPARSSGNAGAEVRDPLRGTWDTGRIRFDRVKAALTEGGYTEPEIEVFLRQFGLRSTTSWRFDVTFYRDSGLPSVIRTAWDPARTATPTDGEHGRYRLLPRHRVAITSVDPRFRKSREVFSYRVNGRTLTLHVVGKSDPSLTRTELRLDMRFMYLMAAAPLRKIG
jgi:hypothetical protein